MSEISLAVRRYAESEITKAYKVRDAIHEIIGDWKKRLTLIRINISGGEVRYEPDPINVKKYAQELSRKYKIDKDILEKIIHRGVEKGIEMGRFIHAKLSASNGHIISLKDVEKGMVEAFKKEIRKELIKKYGKVMGVVLLTACLEAFLSMLHAFTIVYLELCRRIPFGGLPVPP